ncbi:hypothetical protein TRFO_21570 [Tritrichomonas foetus]|uniref:Uncharacterized protein n=1 Tax=Tritrichomonas foetus TaxID=1144522 RepID=A0A1J4KEA5_9EUKA|nr:hypothetical protein TRFO_21570 [Tritrichomonas foetus]|eukprot:OHT09523.1 hypothetical protein TRFO_21570 [Tritrichomonas foetus]
MFENQFANIAYPLIDLPCDNSLSITHSSDHAEIDLSMEHFFQNPEFSLLLSEKVGDIGLSYCSDSSKLAISPAIPFIYPRFTIENRIGNKNEKPEAKYINDSKDNIPCTVYNLRLPLAFKNIKIRFDANIVDTFSDRIPSFASQLKYKTDSFSIRTDCKIYPNFEEKILFEFGKSAFLLKYGENLSKLKFSFTLGKYYLFGVYKRDEILSASPQCGIVHESKNHVSGLKFDIRKSVIKVKEYRNITSNIKLAGMLRYQIPNALQYSFGIKHSASFGKIYLAHGSEKRSITAGVKAPLTKSITMGVFGRACFHEKLEKSLNIDLNFDH